MAYGSLAYHAETCERMAESLGPEMLTSATLPLSGVDLPRC
jgi:hypothetical protein